MLIGDALSSNFVELAPTRYEFAEVVGDEYDDNWLMIRGRVRLDDDEWSFEDPSLLVEEARQISLWLRRVSRGEEHVASPDAADQVRPQLSFLEPNLGLALVARDSQNVILRMFFAHESGIPDAASRIVTSKAVAIVDLCAARTKVADAAESWSNALNDFPERTPPTRATPAE